MHALCELAFSIIGSCDLKRSLLCVSNSMNAINPMNMHDALLNDVEQQFAACMMSAHHVPAQPHEALLVTFSLAPL